MTQTVIDRVEQMATKQGYVTLKFFNRKGEESVYEPNLLAGVGIEDRQNQNAPNLNFIRGNDKDLPPLIGHSNDDDSDNESNVEEEEESDVDESNLEEISGEEVA